MTQPNATLELEKSIKHGETHESNVGKQLREYPNSRARHNDRDDVENQPHDSKREEQAD